MIQAGARRQLRFSDLVTDDEKLSLHAKGAFVVLDLLGSEATVGQLAEKTSADGEVVRRALTELAEAGYVTLTADVIRISSPAAFGLQLGGSQTRVKDSTASVKTMAPPTGTSTG
jgi:hypothetical protein